MKLLQTFGDKLNLMITSRIFGPRVSDIIKECTLRDMYCTFNPVSVISTNPLYSMMKRKLQYSSKPLRRLYHAGIYLSINLSGVGKNLFI